MHYHFFAMDFEEVQIYISNTVQLPAWIVNLYSNFWVWVLDEHVEICWTWNSSYLRSAHITATHYVLDVKNGRRTPSDSSCQGEAHLFRAQLAHAIEALGCRGWRLSIQIVTHSPKKIEKLWQELCVCQNLSDILPYWYSNCTSWSLSVILFTLHILHILSISFTSLFQQHAKGDQATLVGLKGARGFGGGSAET